MLGSTKQRQVTIGPPAVDHRRGVLAGLPRRLGFTECHEAVALGAARVAVGDDDGLEDVPAALVEAAEPVAVGFPGEPTDEDLGVGGVREGRGRRERVQPRAGARRRRRPGRRPRVLLLQSHHEHGSASLGGEEQAGTFAAATPASSSLRRREGIGGAGWKARAE